MKCQDFYCLLLGMTSCDHDTKSSVCRPRAAVNPQCQSVAAGSAGSAPGSASTHASLAESKQNTKDKLKAYLTDDNLTSGLPTVTGR